MDKPVIHLLPNAHIDLVWMWDWREGLAEGVRTCRTVLALMDEYPELTFIRGEAAVYEHVERFAPEVFAAMKRRVAEGRWDVVGGQYVQPDNNMPSTATALRQFALGREYFRARMGVDIRVAWLADAFGHGRGTPEIFRAAGMEYFAMGRPQEWIKPIGSPVFFWRGQGGSELLCVRHPGGIYASERSPDDETFPTRVLERVLAAAPGWPTRHHVLPFGLGDHGGGPSRRHLDALFAWREKHPECDVRFSTLHGYFRAVEEELADPEVRARVPVFEDEINFCQRGCYSSSQKTKRAYRLAESGMERARRVCALLDASPPDLETEKGLCFNAFHDILPGTCIESATAEQIEWIGGLCHAARRAEFHALLDFGRRLRVTVPPPKDDLPEAVPLVFFNAWPRPFAGQVEVEFALDWRPVWSYALEDGLPPVEVRRADGTPVAYQAVAVEHKSLFTIPPWRQRVVFDLQLPPAGWEVLTLAYKPRPERGVPSPAAPAAAVGADTIDNGRYRVTATPDEEFIRILRDGREAVGQPGLRFALFEDREGSWGNMSERPEEAHALKETERWRILRTKVLENGPERARLWVELGGAASRLEATVSLARGRDAVDLAYRLVWNDRARRMKMLMGEGTRVVYDVPGGCMERGRTALVPGGRHQKVHLPNGGGFTLVSDILYGFENEGGHFAAVLARGPIYGTDEPCDADAYPEWPMADRGELRAAFVLAPLDADGERLAEDLEQPPCVWVESVHEGSLPPAGSCWAGPPLDAKAIDMRRRGGALVVTWQDRDGLSATPWKIVTGEQPVLALPSPPPGGDGDA